MIKKILFLLFVFSSTIYAEEKFIVGIDFELINDSQTPYVLKKTEKITVVEAFWYGCPHCYIFEDHLSKWKEKDADDVNFINMPVVFNKPWLVHARAFYTIKELENSEQLHKNFFISYHEQGRTFPTVESILNFLEAQGADIEKAKKIISSESVSKKVQEANYLLESYKIDSVPAIIINDKYRISGRMAKTYKRMIAISEHIIDLERAGRIK